MRGNQNERSCVLCAREVKESAAADASDEGDGYKRRLETQAWRNVTQQSTTKWVCMGRLQNSIRSALSRSPALPLVHQPTMMLSECPQLVYKGCDSAIYSPYIYLALVGFGFYFIPFRMLGYPMCATRVSHFPPSPTHPRLHQYFTWR